MKVEAYPQLISCCISTQDTTFKLAPLGRKIEGGNPPSPPLPPKGLKKKLLNWCLYMANVIISTHSNQGATWNKIVSCITLEMSVILFPSHRVSVSFVSRGQQPSLSVPFMASGWWWPSPSMLLSPQRRESTTWRRWRKWSILLTSKRRRHSFLLNSYISLPFPSLETMFSIPVLIALPWWDWN